MPKILGRPCTIILRLLIILLNNMLFCKSYVASFKNKRAMLGSLGGGQINKKQKTEAANLKALKRIIIDK